jgi:hypothetical protein
VNVWPAGVTAAAFIGLSIPITLFLFLAPTLSAGLLWLISKFVSEKTMDLLRPLSAVSQGNGDRKVPSPSRDLPGGIHFSWPNLTADEVV